MLLRDLHRKTLSLTRDLLNFNTVNPPGLEKECTKFAGQILEDAGYEVTYHDFDKDRTSLVARLKGRGDALPICFTGHVDTVPLGTASWSVDPFHGEISEGRIFGRGSTDMKGGVAAMVLAALQLAQLPNRKAGVILVITAGEERGCRGSFYLAGLSGALDQAGLIIVGEPTSNAPLLGHKGIQWLKARTTGITAHGSMPEQGSNAIYKAARAIAKLEEYRFDASHPLLGRPTLNVGTIAGGMNINSVPDSVTFEIDIRTVPPQKNEQVCRELAAYLGDDVELESIHDGEGFASDPADEWVVQIFDIMEKITGQKSKPAAAPYFTDASALNPAMGAPPTVILGPGELAMAHKTDEFCHISRLEESVEAYVEIGERWLSRPAKKSS